MHKEKFVDSISIVSLFALFLATLSGVALGSTSNNLITEVMLPEHISSAQMVEVDNNGKVWFTEKIGKKLNRFDPETNEFSSFPLPVSWGNVGLSQLTLNADNEIWFSLRRWAENTEEQKFLGKFSPSDGFFTKYILSIDAIPEELFIDRKNVLWFVASNKSKLYRVDPVDFSVKGYLVPTPNAFPRKLIDDAKGQIWFVEPNANKIGKFIPEKEIFKEYSIPTSFTNPGEITIDPKGKVWFVELNTNRIAAFYPDRLRFDEAIIPTKRSSPNAIAADENGNIWFLEYRGNKVGVFNPKIAQFFEYTIPTFSSLPGDMALDHKRSRLWFTEGNTEARKLGMLSTNAALALMAQEIGAGKDSSFAVDLTEVHQEKASQWNLMALIIGIVAIIFTIIIYRTRKGVRLSS